MKKALLTTTLVALSSFLSVGAQAWTQIQNLRIDYSRFLPVSDNHGYIIPQAIVGGKVDFSGKAPVYVSMLIGGQTYTALSDSNGYYSFLVYTNGAAQYSLNAWTNDVEVPGQKASLTVAAELK